MEFSQREATGNYAGDHAFDADEEEKMEEFFAILRRFRHACADRKGRTADGEGGRPAKRRKFTAAPARSSWVPKFEWEDFNTAAEFRGPVSADSAPAVVIKQENTEEIKGKGEGKEEDGNSQLKLSLSL